MWPRPDSVGTVFLCHISWTYFLFCKTNIFPNSLSWRQIAHQWIKCRLQFELGDLTSQVQTDYDSKGWLTNVLELISTRLSLSPILLITVGTAFPHLQWVLIKAGEGEGVIDKNQCGNCSCLQSLVFLCASITRLRSFLGRRGLLSLFFFDKAHTGTFSMFSEAHFWSQIWEHVWRQKGRMGELLYWERHQILPFPGNWICRGNLPHLWTLFRWWHSLALRLLFNELNFCSKTQWHDFVPRCRSFQMGDLKAPTHLWYSCSRCNSQFNLEVLTTSGDSFWSLDTVRLAW